MPTENAMPQSDDVKKKALVRLSIAGIVTTAALGALWWLDQSGDGQKKPAQTSPAPIIAAPEPEVAPPTAETPSAAPDALPEEPPSSTAAPAASNDMPGDTPPPPKVSNNMLAPSRNTAPAVSSAPPSTSAAAPQAATAVPPARPALEALQPNASDKGFVVQLGVFSNPDNARELVEKLKKQGIRAHLEARVQMGPFLNRQEAEKAQAEMRKLGYNALITLPFSALPATK